MKANIQKEKYFNNSDFIEIKIFNSNVKLSINTNDQYLYVLKRFKTEREHSFYETINNINPFISKYYGKIETSMINENYIVIEYIEGETLKDYIEHNKGDISNETKIKIIINILIALEYIHSKNIILRDLNFKNIVIDSNKNAFLIDFDQSKILSRKDLNDECEMTSDMGCVYFSAPEQDASIDYTQKVDIYSLGVITHYIITESLDQIKTSDKVRNMNENILNIKEILDDQSKYNIMNKTIKKCLDHSPESRPTVVQIINLFFEYQYELLINKSNKFSFDEFMKYLTISANQNNSEAQFILGEIYHNGELTSVNIDKSIYYLNLAANQNDSYAQYLLGYIFYTGTYIKKDIDKSIHYLKLSIEQNNSDAQYLLGEIYYYEKNDSDNIKNMISYLQMSADQNNSDAQYLLGQIYLNEEMNSIDIKKSIYYLTLSASQNDQYAQYLLGVIYYTNKYISADINKSIYYLTLSAEQNDSYAQCMLGYIYIHGKYIKIDIKKSIYYLQMSANQSNVEALYLLGKIYYSGEYIKKDISKAIIYFKEAGNYNNSHSKNNLGVIYKNGYGVEKNISIAIGYFQEAIKINNDLYSIFNLLRIYYFELNIEQNNEEFSNIITKVEKRNFKPTILFSYFIYTFGHITTIDKNKSLFFKTIIKDKFNKSRLDLYIKKIFDIEQIISQDKELDDSKLNILQRFSDFFKSYDLEYVSNQFFEKDFAFYMETGTFQDRKLYNDTIQPKQIETNNVNDDFYEGLGIDI